jgi:hypothetical protein
MINLFFPVAFGLSLGRIFVGIPFGDPAEVFPEFVLQVGAGQVFVGPFVIIAKIARVTTVAAAKFPGGGGGFRAVKRLHRIHRRSSQRAALPPPMTSTS